MVELPLFIKLIPKNLKDFKGEVESETKIASDKPTMGIGGGVGRAAEIGAMDEIASEVGDSKGIDLKMLGSIGAMVGGVALIANAIMGLKPIIVMFEMVTKILQLFFLPFVMMLFTILKPVLIFLMKSMILWNKFLSDPIGNLQKAFAGIVESLSGIVGGIVSGLTGIFTGLFEGAKNLGDWLMSLLPKITLNDILSLVFPILGIARVLSWLFGKGDFDIVKYLQSFVKITGDFGKWMWDSLISIWTWEWDFANWLKDSVISSFESGMSGLSDLASWVMEWAKGLISGMFGGALDLLGGGFGGNEGNNQTNVQRTQNVSLNIQGVLDENMLYKINNNLISMWKDLL